MAGVIGIDIDGVLADFNEKFADLIFEQTGKVATLPPKTWNYHRDQAGVTPEENDRLWKTIKSGNFWTSLNPLATKAQFHRLMHFAYTYPTYFITTRGGDRAKFHSEWWLRAQGVYNPTVLIAPHGTKGHTARGLGLTHFLDDMPENCLDVWRDSPGTKVYLFDAAYNQFPPCFRDAGYPPIKRVHSLTEFFNEVEGIEQVVFKQTQFGWRAA